MALAYLIVFLIGMAQIGGVLFSFAVGLRASSDARRRGGCSRLTLLCLALFLCEPLLTLAYAITGYFVFVKGAHDAALLLQPMTLWLILGKRLSLATPALLTAPMALLLFPAAGLFLRQRFYRASNIRILLAGLLRWCTALFLLRYGWQGGVFSDVWWGGVLCVSVIWGIQELNRLRATPKALGDADSGGVRWPAMVGGALSAGVLAGVLINAGAHRLFAVDGKLLYTFSMELAVGDNPSVRGLKWSGDGTRLAAALPHDVVVWEVQNPAHYSQIRTGGIIQGFALSPDGQLLAVAAAHSARSEPIDRTTLNLWRTSDGVPLGEFPLQVAGYGECQKRWGITFSPGGEWLAGVVDNTIRLWRVGEWLPPQILPASAAVSSLRFSPDGRVLVSGHADGTLCSWQADDGRLLRTIKAHDHAVSVIAFNRDGLVLASGGSDGSAPPDGIPKGTIKLWRAEDGVALKTYETSHDAVHTLAFRNDGDALVSAGTSHWGGMGSSVELWRMGSGMHHELPFVGIDPPKAISPDGQVFAASFSKHNRRSSEYWVGLWRVSP